MYTCTVRSLWAAEHKTYAACRVPSQSKLFADYFPYKDTKILLFEAVYGIVHNEIVGHGDSEVYSSQKLVRHPLTFQVIRNFPVRSATQPFSKLLMPIM